MQHVCAGKMLVSGDTTRGQRAAEGAHRPQQKPKLQQSDSDVSTADLQLTHTQTLIHTHIHVT